MNCKEYEFLLSIYVDNECSESEKQELEAHLNTCSSCQKRLDQLLLLKGVVRNESIQLKSAEKVKKKVYNKLYLHFFILFAGLVICASLIAVSGGLVQLLLLNSTPVIIKCIFFAGVGLIMVGLVIIMFDIYRNVIRFMKNK